jgi:phosphoribosylaminoimidazole-succinocarboxamide synthase
LIDEIHTPDSSRYWLAYSYESRFNNQQEPENIDKEFLRLWFKDNCDPYKDETLPKAPDELITTLSSRYISLYEKIVGQAFPFTDPRIPIHKRIQNNLEKALQLTPCL